jgi:hypothetical protein
MRQVQVHGGATSKARASHEPFKEATEASAWGKAGVATGAAPGGLPGGVLGKESGVARGRFTCSLSEDLRPAANRGAIASSGPKVAAVDIASRHRGGEGLGHRVDLGSWEGCNFYQIRPASEACNFYKIRPIIWGQLLQFKARFRMFPPLPSAAVFWGQIFDLSGSIWVLSRTSEFLFESTVHP